MILRKLLKNDGSMPKRSLVKGIKESASKISAAIYHLRELGYVVVDLTSANVIVSIPNYMRKDAFKAVYPDTQSTQEIPFEDQIPVEYNKKPLFKSKGEKEIHRKVSEYWFCSKINQPDYVTCFVFHAGVLTQTIHLGSATNFGSLVSQAIRAIDGIFAKNIFKKSDLVHKLKPEIVGNRRPIKAITEYLVHEKYLVRLEKKNYFQRTGKQHKVETLDEINYYRQRSEPAVMSAGKSRYFYTEEEGLYSPLL